MGGLEVHPESAGLGVLCWEIGLRLRRMVGRSGPARGERRLVISMRVARWISCPTPLFNWFVSSGLCESSRLAGLVLLACRLKGAMGPRLRGDDNGGLLALDWLVGTSAWQRGFERADVRKWAASIAAGGCGA